MNSSLPQTEMSSTSKNPPFSSPPSASDSLNGLKFGQKIYFEDAGTAPPEKSGGGSSPPPVPLKKGRSAVVHGGGRPRCQVEGCGVDLSEAKAYYGRHKVCAVHSKTPSVVVNGIEQRFCQQCSRFHQLTEFDQGKRSCRRRLAGHNERRRKPPPGPFFSSPYGCFPSSVFENGKGGGFVMDFSKYPKLTKRDTWQPTRPPNHSTPLPQSLVHTWYNNSANPPPNPFLQGSLGGTYYPVGPTVPPGERALSLLSNNTWGLQNGPSCPFVSVEDAQMVHSTMATKFSSVLWGLKGHEDGVEPHEVPHQLGFSRFTQPVHNQYSSVDHSRAFDSSTQYLKWLL